MQESEEVSYFKQYVLKVKWFIHSGKVFTRIGLYYKNMSTSKDKMLNYHRHSGFHEILVDNYMRKSR